MLLRGNHEDKNVNRYLGFGEECTKRLGEDINDPNSCFAKINEAFEQRIHETNVAKDKIQNHLSAVNISFI